MGYYMDIICFSFNTNHHIIAHEFSLIFIITFFYIFLSGIWTLF